MHYSIINYSHHAVHYIPADISFITGSLYLLTPFKSYAFINSNNQLNNAVK